MESGQSSLLQWPSFLHGLYSKVQQDTHAEGLRCGEQYLKDGSFPAPRRLLNVQPDALVLTQGVADFQHERPVWRLYMLSTLKSSLYEALDNLHLITVRDAYERAFRETPWGALYFAIEQMGPVSAQCAALRLQAVVRFWEPLASTRYLFKTLGQLLTLDELMETSCGWALAAWCPEAKGKVRERMARAFELMARATREESLAIILRQLPHVIPLARNLQHRDTLADPAFHRERLASIDEDSFERVSAARTADLLWLVNGWDRELGQQ